MSDGILHAWRDSLQSIWINLIWLNWKTCNFHSQKVLCVTQSVQFCELNGRSCFTLTIFTDLMTTKWLTSDIFSSVYFRQSNLGASRIFRWNVCSEKDKNRKTFTLCLVYKNQYVDINTNYFYLLHKRQIFFLFHFAYSETFARQGIFDIKQRPVSFDYIHIIYFL